MTHTQLTVLLKVLESGSLTAAALELDVAQSSVSRALAELERDLGVRLVQRGRHGATATDAGRRIAGHARRVLELHDAIRQEVALLAGGLRGRLRVASYPTVVREFVGDVLVAFGHHHPEVEIELDECAPIDVEEAVRDGRADVGFALLSSADELIAFEVDRAGCVAVVPSGWRGDRIERDELASAPFLVYGDPACERVILGYLRALIGPVEPALRLHETATILSMVARGRGVSIMTPDSLVGQPGVRAAELPAPLERVTGAVVRPESLALPTVKAFLTSLRRSGRIPVELPAAPPEPAVAAH